MVRMFLCWWMIMALPVAMFASDPGAAMLYGEGKVALNGNQIPGSSAIFPGDKVETQASNQGRINFSGATVAIIGDASLKLEMNAVALDHGYLSVMTSISTTVHDCEITVTPVADMPTEYEVHDVNGRIEVDARKNDVTLEDRGKSVTVKEGQQTTREKVCKIAGKPGGALPAATGVPPALKIGAGVIAAGGLICLLFRCNDPVSPYTSRGKGCLC